MTINQTSVSTAGANVPDVPITVDQETGEWSTDSLPMLYVPLHFFMNNHLAMEKELGVERYAELLYDAGYRSAWTWCEHEALKHDIKGVAVYEHYMQRISQRGWGKFKIETIDLKAATASISLRHSAFARVQPEATHGVDYMFTGWFAGAMDQICSAQGRKVHTLARQVRSETETGASYGLFEVVPR